MITYIISLYISTFSDKLLGFIRHPAGWPCNKGGILDSDGQNSFSGADRVNADNSVHESGEPLRTLEFFRAIDTIIAGIVLLACLLNFKYMTDILPIPFVQYIYLIPVLFIFRGGLSFPGTGFKLFQYGKALERLIWSVSALLLLSPFLHWWMRNADSLYLLYNFLFLCMLSSIFLVYLSNLSHAISKEDNLVWMCRLARITRFSALYLMLAPVLALFVTVAFGKSSGQDIFWFFIRLEKWKLLVFLSPVVLSLIVLIQLRFEKYRNMK